MTHSDLLRTHRDTASRAHNDNTVFDQLWLRSFHEPICLPVSEAEQQEFFDRYQNRANEDNRFIIVSTTDGREVAISVSDLQAANLLFQAGVSKQNDKEEDDGVPGVGWILIWLRGVSEPIRSGSEDSMEIASMYMELDAAPDEPLAIFTDEDGESMMLNRRDLVMIEVEKCLIEECQSEMEAGATGDASDRKRKKRKGSARPKT